jgi:hypothetical protein
MPAAGGPYVFQRKSFGPLLAFLSGWTYFFVIISASVAWLAITFAAYLGQFFTLSRIASQVIASAANNRGVQLGAAVQKTFTAMMVGGLAVLVGSRRQPMAEYHRECAGTEVFGELQLRPPCYDQVSRRQSQILVAALPGNLGGNRSCRTGQRCCQSHAGALPQTLCQTPLGDDRRTIPHTARSRGSGSVTEVTGGLGLRGLF